MVEDQTTIVANNDHSDRIAIGTDEILGTLVYERGMGGLPPARFEGWVRRSIYNENVIVARKFRGRNRWQLTSFEHIISFQPKVKNEEV
jgi:hypothetical protein